MLNTTKNEFWFTIKCANLERDLLALLGGVDLDLERLLAWPLFSSYSLILYIICLTFYFLIQFLPTYLTQRTVFYSPFKRNSEYRLFTYSLIGPPTLLATQIRSLWEVDLWSHHYFQYWKKIRFNKFKLASERQELTNHTKIVSNTHLITLLLY